jgi:hypothetical protein
MAYFIPHLIDYFYKHPEEQAAILEQTNAVVQTMEDTIGQQIEPLEQQATISQPNAATAIQPMNIEDEPNPIDHPRIGDVFELKFEPDNPVFKIVQVTGIYENYNRNGNTIRVESFDPNNPVNGTSDSWTAAGLGLNQRNTKYLGNWKYSDVMNSVWNPITRKYDYSNEGGKLATKRRRLRKKSNKKRGKSRKQSIRKRK